ncbi:MAG: TolC family protein [Candidatus Acidiferrales bacterium]
MTANLWKCLRTSTAILFVLILFPNLSNAQTENAPPKLVTLEDALNYALQHYPAVRASLEQVSAARAGVTLARTQYLPQLNGVYQDSRATQNQVPGIWLPTPITPTVEGPIGPSSEQSYWGSQAAALFSWEPLDFGLRSARVGQARSAEDKSQADLALTQLQVATAVGNYFLLALANQQAVLAAQANVERWQVFNNSIHVLVDNQLRPGADASRADAELARAKTQLYQSQKAERMALDTLAALMGVAGSEIKLDSSRLLDLPRTELLPGVSASAHPLARDQMAAVREVQAAEKILQRTDYPRVLLQTEGFGRGSQVSNNGTILGNWNGLAPARGNWVTGITILFPDIFGFKALSVEKQIAKANERSQQAHYDQTIQDLTGQMQAAREQLKAAQLVAQETPTELAAARQSETQSRARYQSDLATLVEVADAENLLAQAEMDDSIARLSVWRGLFGVAYAQGNLQDFLQLLQGTAPEAH